MTHNEALFALYCANLPTPGYTPAHALDEAKKSLAHWEAVIGPVGEVGPSRHVFGVDWASAESRVQPAEPTPSPDRYVGGLSGSAPLFVEVEIAEPTPAPKRKRGRGKKGGAS